MSFKDKINLEKLPKHIAIIMDGNGRWAKKHGHDRVFGHYQGVESVREIAEAAAEIGDRNQATPLPARKSQNKGSVPMPYKLLFFYVS